MRLKKLITGYDGSMSFQVKLLYIVNLILRLLQLSPRITSIGYFIASAFNQRITSRDQKHLRAAVL